MERRTLEEDYIARDTVKDRLGRDFALYADDINLVTGCIRTMREMLHAIQREGALYGLFLNIKKTFLIRAGCARRASPRLLDYFKKIPIPHVDSERTLGFDIGPFVQPRDILRKRGKAMLGAMEKYKAVWASDLTLKTKLERFESLVVNKGIWGLHVLAVLDLDFSNLEYIYARCLRRILNIPAAYISRTAPAALFGGWAAALPVWRQRFPGWAARFCAELDAPLSAAPCFVAARAAAALLAQEGFEVPPWRQLVDGLEPDRDAAPDLEPGEWNHSWQFFAADAREQFAADQFFAHLPPHGRALFLGQQGRHRKLSWRV